MTSMTMPPIGTGNFLKYPPSNVARVTLEAVKEFAANNTDSSLTDIYLVIYDSAQCQVFMSIL